MVGLAGRSCWRAVALAAYGVWAWQRAPLPADHRHDAGDHGGIIIAVGHDHHHVEALFTSEGEFKLFTLGQDQTRVVSVPTQTVTAYVRTPQTVEAIAVELKPTPQPGDPQGQTSAFSGELPLEFVGAQLMVVVPSITIGKERYRFGFATRDQHPAQMPAKVTDKAERELYLQAGGKYTDADIGANGGQTASEKYRGFRSAHDLHPQPGDTVCPITGTKANPKCAWIVGGQQYTFCCPPCIDEFVKLAKERPDEVLEPTRYVQP